jgi:hypothetical protein
MKERDRYAMGKSPVTWLTAWTDWGQGRGPRQNLVVSQSETDLGCGEYGILSSQSNDRGFADGLLEPQAEC